LTFQFFNEIGIIHQLSTTAFNRKLPDGLHVSHFAILNHLMRLGDGKTPNSISDAFQVTKGTMTHTLGTLTKRNLIAIQPHPSDGRSKLVFLTDAGRSFHSDAIESLNPLIDLLSRNVELDTLIRMLPDLQAIREILDDNRNA
jgi:DNA-binding MarR family transcriptional regulator